MRNTVPPSHELWVCHLGHVPYYDGVAIQATLRARRQAGELPDTMLLLEHPPVYTRGRRADAEDLPFPEDFYRAKGIDVADTDRGGKLTYHGPGQLVGYPILDLHRVGADILLHIRNLERSLIAYLQTLGLESEPGDPGFTGVWSSGAKVAAIGVKLNQRAVTSHGFALNLTSDLDTFNTGIVPCGLVGRRATSVLELSGRRLDVEAAARDYAP
ncbi:MAG TPA: lipoyl(octanoyl) transferase LipB, partial [Solirubrobacteraceae bacterium]|nr:lipoyl(octanoyl) transferase LipB [Solirubrobacteraceae bacterium]